MRTPPNSGRLETSSPDTRRESTERRILESAVELIGEGVTWHALGIRQVAERADISRTAFYDFFASKNEVLEHLVNGLHDDVEQILDESASPGAGPLPLDDLRALFSRIADCNAQHGPVLRAFIDAAGQDDRIHALRAELAAVYVGRFAAAIDGARAARPELPATPGSRALAGVLLTTAERTILAVLRAPAAEADRTELLETLALVWERAIFNGQRPG